jgi:hypothetical protein
MEPGVGNGIPEAKFLAVVKLICGQNGKGVIEQGVY